MSRFPVFLSWSRAKMPVHPAPLQPNDEWNSLSREPERRTRTRCTLCRSRKSAFGSPARHVTQVRSLSPAIGGTLSPPLCHSPIRGELFGNRSQSKFGQHLNVASKCENLAFFSSQPPSEPIRLIKCPQVHYSRSELTPKTSIDLTQSSRRSENSLYVVSKQESMKILVEASTTRNARKIVRRLLRSLLRDLPIDDGSSYIVSKSNSKLFAVGSEIEHRHVSVQAFTESTAVSVGDSYEVNDEDNVNRKEHSASREWVGGIRALRDSHLRLMLRQLRQLRRIERLDRSIKLSKM